MNGSGSAYNLQVQWSCLVPGTKAALVYSGLKLLQRLVIAEKGKPPLCNCHPCSLCCLPSWEVESTSRQPTSSTVMHGEPLGGQPRKWEGVPQSEALVDPTP